MTDLDKLIEAVGAGTSPTAMTVNQALECGLDSLRIDQVRSAINGSLDAALRVKDAIAPEWKLQNLQQFKAGHWLATVYHPRGADWPKWTPYPVEHATNDDPARALLLAILRAYRATKTEGS